MAVLAVVQTGAAQPVRFGEKEVRASASGEERTAQSDLWVMDVVYKPMRMIQVELTNPETGEKKLEFVWYIVYRAYNRKLERPENENAPENVVDPQVITPPLFVPEFTLQTTDTAELKTYEDQIIPEALAVINKREKGAYRNNVDIVGPIPAASEYGEADREGVWGVAMWRGIDLKSDHYTVFMTGFSNGIRVAKNDDGDAIIQAKSIMQKYWRPGDEFEQSEPDIRQIGPSEWIYR